MFFAPVYAIDTGVVKGAMLAAAGCRGGSGLYAPGAVSTNGFSLARSLCFEGLSSSTPATCAPVARAGSAGVVLFFGRTGKIGLVTGVIMEFYTRVTGVIGDRA